MTQPQILPDPRRDPIAIRRRNRRLGLILVGLAVLFYVGIQLRWGWSK